MRVLVLGAYGFIGLAVVRALRAAGHDVVGLGRSRALGARHFAPADWRTADISALTGPERWEPLLAGIEVVVNASGALQDGSRDRVASVQHLAIEALVEACERAQVRRFVQISAPGAAIDSSTEFMRSKARADGRLRSSTLDWVILRPGLVIGPDAYGGTALVRALAGLPIVGPRYLAGRRVQTVALDDVAGVAVRAVDGALAAGSDLDLVEDEAHTLGAIVDRFRRWLGLAPPRWQPTVPDWLGDGVGRVADVLGHVGWRSPLRTTALRALGDEVLGDPGPLRAVLGRGLASLDETLDALPATVQERRFARLYLAPPLMVGALAAFWLASGAIALFDVAAAAATIPPGTLAPRAAEALVIGGALLDLVLGAGVLYRPTARPACLAMIALTAAYLAAGTMLDPALWADPLGPLVKPIPAAVLAWVTWLVLDER